MCLAYRLGWCRAAVHLPACQRVTSCRQSRGEGQAHGCAGRGIAAQIQTAGAWLRAPCYIMATMPFAPPCTLQHAQRGSQPARRDPSPGSPGPCTQRQRLCRKRWRVSQRRRGRRHSALQPSQRRHRALCPPQLRSAFWRGGARGPHHSACRLCSPKAPQPGARAAAAGGAPGQQRRAHAAGAGELQLQGWVRCSVGGDALRCAAAGLPWPKVVCKQVNQVGTSSLPRAHTCFLPAVRALCGLPPPAARADARV